MASEKKTHVFVYLAEILILLAIALLAHLISGGPSLPALSAPNENVEFATFGSGFSYIFTKDAGLLSVRGKGAMPSFDTSADVPWKGFRKDIRRVIIGDGITSVSDHAFQGCGNLKSVVFPASLEKIGPLAFEGCGGITGVETTGNPEVLRRIIEENDVQELSSDSAPAQTSAVAVNQELRTQDAEAQSVLTTSTVTYTATPTPTSRIRKTSSTSTVSQFVHATPTPSPNVVVSDPYVDSNGMTVQTTTTTYNDGSSEVVTTWSSGGVVRKTVTQVTREDGRYSETTSTHDAGGTVVNSKTYNYDAKGGNLLSDSETVGKSGDTQYYQVTNEYATTSSGESVTTTTHTDLNASRGSSNARSVTVTVRDANGNPVKETETVYGKAHAGTKDDDYSEEEETVRTYNSDGSYRQISTSQSSSRNGIDTTVTKEQNFDGNGNAASNEKITQNTVYQDTDGNYHREEKVYRDNGNGTWTVTTSYYTTPALSSEEKPDSSKPSETQTYSVAKNEDGTDRKDSNGNIQLVDSDGENVDSVPKSAQTTNVTTPEDARTDNGLSGDGSLGDRIRDLINGETSDDNTAGDETDKDTGNDSSLVDRARELLNGETSDDTTGDGTGNSETDSGTGNNDGNETGSDTGNNDINDILTNLPDLSPLRSSSPATVNSLALPSEEAALPAEESEAEESLYVMNTDDIARLEQAVAEQSGTTPETEAPSEAPSASDEADNIEDAPLASEAQVSASVPASDDTAAIPAVQQTQQTRSARKSQSVSLSPAQDAEEDSPDPETSDSALPGSSDSSLLDALRRDSNLDASDSSASSSDSDSSLSADLNRLQEDREARDAEREAEREERQAEREARQAAREARKAERQSARSSDSGSGLLSGLFSR